jgi:serine/threonine protein kinase
MDLLKKMLNPNPLERISAADILAHEFLNKLSGLKFADQSRTSNFLNFQKFFLTLKNLKKNLFQKVKIRTQKKC